MGSRVEMPEPELREEFAGSKQGRHKPPSALCCTRQLGGTWLAVTEAEGSGTGAIAKTREVGSLCSG